MLRTLRIHRPRDTIPRTKQSGLAAVFASRSETEPERDRRCENFCHPTSHGALLSRRCGTMIPSLLRTQPTHGDVVGSIRGVVAHHAEAARELRCVWILEHGPIGANGERQIRGIWRVAFNQG